MGEIHELFVLALFLVWFAGATPDFQTEVFSWTSARVVRPKMLVFFPAFGGPDRSFWPDVRRDIRPKTSSLG